MSTHNIGFVEKLKKLSGYPFLPTCRAMLLHVYITNFDMSSDLRLMDTPHSFR